MHMNARKRRSVFVVPAMVLLVSIITITLQGCGGAGKTGNKITLILGGYTTPRQAYGKGVIPAFQKYWKEKTGHDVEFQESYQGSGAQSRSIIGGLGADNDALSLEGEISHTSEDVLLTHDRESHS